MHQQSSDSPATASVTVTAVLGASVSSSNLSAGLRKVRPSDRELFQRVQRVVAPDESVDLRGLSAQRGWKHVRAGVPGRMKMYFRALPGVSSTPPFQTRQCQVVVGGEIRARVSELLSLLRTPTESESNALLRALYGSRFIYSSLVHAVPSSERGSLLSPPLRASGGAVSGQQLMVRTVSFAHTRLHNPFKQRPLAPAPHSDSRATSDSHSSSHEHQTSGAKNEQCCYIELLTPTQNGFKITFCSLDTTDLTAGKAPPGRVIELHPVSGWLTVQPTPNDPETLRVTCQAAFPGEQPGGCDSRVAQARLLFIAKGVCRLEKVLHRRQRQLRQPRSASGRVWQTLTKPFRALGVSDEDSSEGAHHNWHCIACTQSFLPTLRKSWRRCDLCAYRVCAEPPCCSHERVAIYSRYVAPLLVCARCRECIEERDSGHQGSGHRVTSATGDIRYAGLSLRFTDQGNQLEPESELDSNILSHDQWGLVGNINSTRRSRTSSRMKRRAQSDPPPVLGLALSSSGDDNSLSAVDPEPLSGTTY
ncbi:hypothetical protein PHYPSEUDO_006451 [Phytophthora pseudosyringae]|uniref:FYVE-type domain-containing protein n=1 Tax=Phytophthora pseudosyringae TaxID=221518 RepID=A0A8T1VJF2_9STRA|nr:hypothetical protein PHYPSEUDO_006451 [Phytophthora pseudosyringae]